MLGSFRREKALQKYSLSFREGDLQNQPSDHQQQGESQTREASAAPDMARHGDLRLSVHF